MERRDPLTQSAEGRRRTVATTERFRSPNNYLRMCAARSSHTPEVLIELCTDEKNTEENWSAILEVCEQVNAENSKKILTYILGRVFHRNPHVSKQAIVLLDACMKNCCNDFQSEVISGQLFRREAKKSLPQMHQKTRALLLKTINSWIGEVKTRESPRELLDSISSKSYSSDMMTLTSEEMQSERKKTAMREEAELVNAIAASLQTTRGQGAAPTTTTASAAYPSLANASSRSAAYAPQSQHHVLNGDATPREPKKVRALYDFEAAEDNELTFKAGEIILVLDDSDANWWKGSNQRGEGLFPSSFVVSLDKEGSPQDSNPPTESTNKSDAQSTAAPTLTAPPPRIDETLLDQCTEMLGEADPTALDDSAMPELAAREAQCYAMGPLIDAEMERIDREHYELMDLNKRLMEAMQMYNTLMTTSSVSPATAMHTQGPPQVAWGQQQGLNMGYAPVPGGYPSGPVPPSVAATGHSGSMYSAPTQPVYTGQYAPPQAAYQQVAPGQPQDWHLQQQYRPPYEVASGQGAYPGTMPPTSVPVSMPGTFYTGGPLPGAPAANWVPQNPQAY